MSFLAFLKSLLPVKFEPSPAAVVPAHVQTEIDKLLQVARDEASKVLENAKAKADALLASHSVQSIIDQAEVDIEAATIAFNQHIALIKENRDKAVAVAKSPPAVEFPTKPPDPSVAL